MIPSFSRAAASAVLITLSLQAPATFGDDHTFTYEDVFDLEFAAGMDVHPESGLIVYERRSMDILADRQRSNLWVVRPGAGVHRPLLTGTDSYTSPHFSPDGTQLAYLSGVDGGRQIYVRYMDSGATVRVTDVREAPGAMAWSPDGSMLAFTMRVPDDQKPLFTGPTPPKDASWAGQSRLITEMRYRFDGVGFLPSGHTHIFVVPAEGGTPRQLTSGAFEHGGSLSWAADGSAVYFSANRNDDWQADPRESDIYKVSLSGDITQLTERDGVESAPRVSPNGEHLIFTGFEENGLSSPVASLWLMDLETGAIRNLTPDLDRSVGDAEWSEDGESVLVAFDDQGKRVLARVTPDGDFTRLSDRLGGSGLGRPYTSGGFAPTPGGGAVITLGRPDRPADLALVDDRGRVTQLTDLNSDALDGKRMATIERVATTSSVDGREIEGWLAVPAGAGADEALPLILEIHGGPHAAYGPGFSAEIQLLASKGYAVLYTNPRGSTSYGEEFANTIHQNYPSEDYNDLMDMVDMAIARGTADPDRLFVTGGSGGGVLSAWIIGKTDRFRAAVVAKPVINWISFTFTADIAPFVRNYWFDKDPWEDISDHWKRSPLRLVGNVSTPTMLLTGDRDLRTPMSETEQYYMALKMRGVESVLVQVPDAFHGIAARPSNLIQKIGHVVAWFDKYDVKDDPDSDTQASATD